MRIVSILAAVVALAGASPVWAQAAPSARQLALAERYLELSQGTAMNEAIAEQMEQAFGKSDLPVEQRDWLTRNMTATLVQVIDAAFDDLAQDVAVLFTEDELQAAIAFHETPLGRSFANKSMELGMRIEQAMTPHIVAGMEALSGKYCARFTCETGDRVSRGKTRN